MNYILDRRRIETEILKMYALCTNCKYHWSEIMNHLWLAMKIPSDVNKRTFGVNISRALSELVKEGVLKYADKGHKNVRYVLAPKGLERVIKNYKANPVISFMLLGTYRIGDSYEMFKKRAMKKLEELHEKELCEFYEEAKGYAEKIAKKRNAVC